MNDHIKYDGRYPEGFRRRARSVPREACANPEEAGVLKELAVEDGWIDKECGDAATGLKPLISHYG